MNNFFKIWGHLPITRKVQLGALFLLMVIVSVAEALSLGSLLPFLDSLGGASTYPNLSSGLIRYYPLTSSDISSKKILTIIFVFFVFLAGVLRLALVWAQIRLSFLIGADFSVRMFQNALYRPYLDQISSNTGDVISSITSRSNAIIANCLYPGLLIASSLMMIFIIIGTIIFIDTFVALSILIVFSLIYSTVIFFTKKSLKSNGERINEQYTKVIKVLQEGLGGIRDVKLIGSQQFYVSTYQKSENALRMGMANVQIIGASPKFIIESLGMVVIAIVGYVLSKDSNNLATSVPILGVLALAAHRLLPLFQQIYSSWASIKGSQSAVAQGLNVLSLDVDVANKNDVCYFKFENEIEFSNVSFCYPESTKFALNNLNFSIKKGEKVGIIGETGSGKSTLLDLFMFLLAPTSGSILVDGKLLNHQNSTQWQKNLAHVPQNIFLLDGTLAENIAFGEPKTSIDLTRIIYAAQQAQLDNSVKSWRDGYGTLIGERGIKLSGGQRQRIGIARALYRKANVLVLDEATSALDSATEENVVSAIRELGEDLTVIVVAHRLGTLKHCSRIIEIRDGSVHRIGSYEEFI